MLDHGRFHYLNQLKKFKSFLGREVWFLFITSILVGVLWFAVESSFIFVLQGLLRAMGVLEAEHTFLPAFYPSGVGGAVLCLLIFGLLRSMAIIMKQYFAEVTSQAFVRSQREKTLEYSLSQTAEVSMHSTLNVFNNMIGQSAGVIQLMAMLINTIVAGALFFSLGMVLAPAELAIGLFLLFILFFPLGFLNKKIISYGKSHAMESHILSHVMVLGLKNHFLLKIYNLTAGEIEKGKRAAKRYEYFFKRYVLLSSLKSGFPHFAGAVIVSLISYVSLEYVKTPGIKLLSFIYIFMRLSQGLSEGSVILSGIRFSLASFKDLYRWHLRCGSYLTKRALLPKRSGSSAFESHAQNSGIAISARDLCFQHVNGEELFAKLNFNLSAGEILLLKGRSGSGKSTLLTLIVGLQKPLSGEVLINGESAEEVREFIAPFISYVGPEPYIIGGTLRENLIYGNVRDDYSDSELIDVLKKAHILEILNEDGLARELREVTELSTGQKQRLAIARALLRSPKLLILDEATANLDSKTEREIIETIKSLSKNITVVIISHKNSFDLIADQILDLESRREAKHADRSL